MADARGAALAPDRLRTAVTWLTVPWTAALAWVYLTAVLRVPPLEGIGAALVLGIVIVLPWFLLRSMELRWGRRAAAATLAGLAGVLAGFLVIHAQVLWAAVVAGITFAAAYGYGVFAATRLDLEDTRGIWQGVPVAIALGLSVLILLGIVLGAAGLLFRFAVVAILVVGLGLMVRELRKALTQSHHAGLPVSEMPAVAWWWGLTVPLLIGLVGAVAPEVRHDALAAHLPVAREFAVRGRIAEIPQIMHSYFQHNGALLYALGMLVVPGEAVPKILHYGAGVVASLLTYDLGSRLWHPRVGLAAAVVVAGTPLLWWVGGAAYTDQWTVLFATAAVTGLARFPHRLSPRQALALGLLAGAALGVKGTSLIVALPVATAVLWRAATSPAGPKDAGRAFGAFALGALLTGGFWYGRAWILTGNPFFSLFNFVFKSPHWPVERARFLPYGMGTTGWDFLLVPWRVVRYPQLFVEEGNIGILYLAFLPAALVAIAQGRVPRWLWVTVVSSSLLLFSITQYIRYLLPILPLAAVIGAAGLLEGFRPGRVRVPASTGVAAGLVLILGVTAAATGWIASGAPNFPLDVARGAVSREEYTAAYVGGFRVAQFVRHALPESARIFGAGERLSFYYDRYFMSIPWAEWLVHSHLRRPVLRARTGREIQTTLLEAGFTHLVLHPDSPLVARQRRSDVWLTREAPWEEGPYLEYAYHNYYLFRLDSAPGDRPRVRGPERLEHSVRRTRVGPSGSLVQRVAVIPERLYALEALIQSVTPSGKARLSIQWVDEDGRVLDHPTWREMSVDSGMKRYALACTAPGRARAAVVRLMATDGEIEFDDAHFYELQ